MPASITAKVWVLAWVSTPMTYAKEFATIVMVTLILSLWVDVTTGVDPGKSLRGRPVISHGHHKWSDKLLIKPSQWTGSAPVPTGPDRSWARHSKPIAEGQTLHESQPNRAPTPTLPANPRSATQRLTDASICLWPDIGIACLCIGVACRRCLAVPVLIAVWQVPIDSFKPRPSTVSRRGNCLGRHRNCER